jgi:hypothetical protein
VKRLLTGMLIVLGGVAALWVCTTFDKKKSNLTFISINLPQNLSPTDRDAAGVDSLEHGGGNTTIVTTDLPQNLSPSGRDAVGVDSTEQNVSDSTGEATDLPQRPSASDRDAATMVSMLPHVFIVGEDKDPDTIERHSRVFDKVLKGMVDTMVNYGFDVIDETALTYEISTQGRTRRNDMELIKIAKEIGIDTLVIFSIYLNAYDYASGKKVTARIEGRLFSVNDGYRLGNFEFDPQYELLLSKPCSRNDIIEEVGKIAKVVGEEVGDNLAQRLIGYGTQGSEGQGGRLQEWTLIFDGFTRGEMMEMVEILERFTGYAGLRTKTNGIKTNLHHEYWYKSSINSSKMERNLHKLLEEFKHEGRVYMSGLKVEVKKSPKPTQIGQPESDEW